MHEHYGEWTAAERWLAGLLWGDGYLGKNDALQLSLIEEDLVRSAALVAGCQYRTYPQRPRNGQPRRPLHRFGFTDHVLAGQLRSLGFGPKRERVWPAPLASGTFLRGLFDGNGWVGWAHDPRAGASYLKTAMSGTPPLLGGMQELAGQGIAPTKINQNGNGWQVQWAHRDSLRLAGLMYREPGPFRVCNRDRFLARTAA